MSREMHRPDGKLHITDPFTGLHSQTEIQSRKLKQFWSNVFFHRLLLEDQLTNTYNDLSEPTKTPKLCTNYNGFSMLHIFTHKSYKSMTSIFHHQRRKQCIRCTSSNGYFLRPIGDISPKFSIVKGPSVLFYTKHI